VLHDTHTCALGLYNCHEMHVWEYIALQLECESFTVQWYWSEGYMKYVSKCRNTTYLF